MNLFPSSTCHITYHFSLFPLPLPLLPHPCPFSLCFALSTPPLLPWLLALGLLCAAVLVAGTVRLVFCSPLFSCFLGLFPCSVASLSFITLFFWGPFLSACFFTCLLIPLKIHFLLTLPAIPLPLSSWYSLHWRLFLVLILSLLLPIPFCCLLALLALRCFFVPATNDSLSLIPFPRLPPPFPVMPQSSTLKMTALYITGTLVPVYRDCME